MLNESTEDQSSNDQLLMEIIDALHQLTLVDSILNCQVCNEPLTDGDEIICHLQSPAGTVGFDIAQIRCQIHDDGMKSLLPLGTDELLIAGRVGRCVDQATQQSWPVLVAPTLRGVSSAATTTARKIDPEPTVDNPDEPLAVPIDTTDAETIHRGQDTADSEMTNRQNTTLARWDRSTQAAEGE